MKKQLYFPEKQGYIKGKGLQTSFTEAAAAPSLNGTTSGKISSKFFGVCRMSVFVRCGAQLRYACLNSCKSFFTAFKHSKKDNINATTEERA